MQTPPNTADVREPMQRAGKIDAYGVGTPAEYPKMLYRKGNLTGHKVNELPILIDNKYDVETRCAENAEDEAEALANGWFLTPDLKPRVPSAAELAAKAKDDQIAALKAQLSERGGSIRTPKPEREG